MTGCVVTIGNFDGCHLGHQALFEKAYSISEAYQLRRVALTFDPHPQEFFSPNRPHPRLFSRAQKKNALVELDVDEVVTQSFDQKFSEMSHTAFYDEFLKKKLKARAIVVGADFCFGHKRLGNTAYLKSRTEEDGLILATLDPQQLDGEIISSSLIRKALDASGDVEKAARTLGRPYTLTGVVEHGAHQGKKMGIPTANLGSVEQMLPKRGVYVGYAYVGVPPTVMTIPEDLYPVVLNIGVKPTMSDAGKVSVEAHVLEGIDSSDSLYGKPMALYLLHRLRDEQTFTDRDALIRQIQSDIKQAKQLLAVE